jgi:hypothetical protein
MALDYLYEKWLLVTNAKKKKQKLKNDVQKNCLKMTQY